MESEHNGFVSNDRYFMLRCGACKLENYTSAVASGICAWCGADGRTPSQKANQALKASWTRTTDEQYPPL